MLAKRITENVIWFLLLLQVLNDITSHDFIRLDAFCIFDLSIFEYIMTKEELLWFYFSALLYVSVVASVVLLDLLSISQTPFNH